MRGLTTYGHRFRWLFVGALVGAAIGGAGVAGAATDTITACVTPSNHLLFSTSGTCGLNETKLTWNKIGPPGPRGLQGETGPQGATGPQGPAGSVSSVINRDALATLQPGETVTLDSFCQAGEKTLGGSVNLIPDGSGTVLTSRPVGNTFGDSPSNGRSPIGWRGVIRNDTGLPYRLAVVHAFCAS